MGCNSPIIWESPRGTTDTKCPPNFRKHVERNRKIMHDELDARSVRLQDELDRVIKLLSWSRECLEGELTKGLGYKKILLSDADLRKLKDLTLSMNTAVRAKIAYDEAQKRLADSMTPEEEFESVCSYIRTLDRDRLDLIKERIKGYGITLGLADEVRAEQRAIGSD